MNQPAVNRIDINAPVLAKNESLAAANRRFFQEHRLVAVNMISSPGSGKTSLLEAMAGILGNRMVVIEGDQQTERDARRVRDAGSPAVQIETGDACHLDALAVKEALSQMNLSGSQVRVVVIENVGNLICPSGYDLGEEIKAVILSLPEGDDKVLKYPSIFSRADALIINKIDLAPYLDFDIQRAIRETACLNSCFDTFRLSAKTGQGVDKFCHYLLNKADKI